LHALAASDDVRPSLSPPAFLRAQLPADQLYCVFVLADGGADLEGFELRDAAEARALLLQVTLSLAVAEDALSFEHRDLHWGNVLLRRAPPGAPPARHTLRGVRLASEREGLDVTLIDFTLSRMAPRHGGGGVAFYDLEADPELFQGPSRDCQSDTYRKMRKAVRRDWSSYAPRTNALWLHYLADTLLTKKAFPLDKAERRALQAFRGRCGERYGSAADAVTDELFEGMWHAEN
jgi:serine/threonine-protein kinase haspin